MSELREPDRTYETKDYIVDSWDETVELTISVQRYTLKDVNVDSAPAQTEVRYDYVLPGGDDSDEWYISYEDARRDALDRVGA